MRKKPYRTHFDIINDILKCALTPKQKTDVFYEARLGGMQYTQYLANLLEKGLLETLPNGLLQTTEKGKEFLEVFKQTKRLLGLEKEG